MKISAPGLRPEQEAPFCDALAEAVATTSRKLRLDRQPASVIVEFGQASPRSGASAKMRRETGPPQRGNEDAIDFSALVGTPRANADLLRLDAETHDKLAAAMTRLAVRPLVYDTWGLSEIDPFPRLTLNFTGPPGTGKTLAAHHLAKRLGKRIIEVSYADVVSKYFGEAAKNLSALYAFAAAQDAVLFVDEAETLLSRRTGNAREGADHAVNSMRSQLLILMEKAPIISIFASNLVQSYDPAFESRLITIPFALPDLETRALIWAAHLPGALPLEPDVDARALSQAYAEVNGRQIVRAVVEAAHRAAAQGRKRLKREDFDWAIELVLGPGPTGATNDTTHQGQSRRAAP